MKKFNILGKALSISTIAFVCCLMISLSAFADMVSNAGLIPAGYGYTHGKIPVIQSTGKPEIHDAAIMRYDRNSRIRDIDDGVNQNAYYNERYQQNDQQYEQ